MTATNTPGPFGYLVALAVTFTLYGPIVALPELLDGDVAGFLGFALVVSVVASVYGGPVAVLGALAVHLGCRRTASQTAHVLAATVVGYLGGLLVGAGALDLPAYDPMVLAAGVAAGLGREAAVPFVEARRRRVAQAAEPVDRDWHPEARAGYPDPSPAPDEG